MNTFVTIRRDGYDSLTLLGRTSASIRILGDQAFAELPEPFEVIAEQIVSYLLLCCDNESAFSHFKNIISSEALTHNCLTQQDSRNYQFVCTSIAQLNKKAILAESEDISDDLAKLSLNRKMWGGDDYPYCGFGVKDHGELISWCVENSHYLAEKETEIGVRTEDNYRRRGYALSNTVCLCQKLLLRGMKKVFYECSIDNHASFRLAQKAGLEMTGEVLWMCFKK